MSQRQLELADQRQEESSFDFEGNLPVEELPGGRISLDSIGSGLENVIVLFLVHVALSVLGGSGSLLGEMFAHDFPYQGVTNALRFRASFAGHDQVGDHLKWNQQRGPAGPDSIQCLGPLLEGEI